MRVNFYDILASHSRAYPRMTGEDYYALAYESEFGRVYDGDDCLEALAPDLDSVKTDALEPFTVAIGGGYSRLNFAPIKQYLSAENVRTLISLTAREGSEDGLKRKTSLISRSAKMGILPSEAEGIAECGDEPHHSALYKRLYGASYRIIEGDLAPLIPALCLISEALGKAEAVSVALDGRSGSGKTFAHNTIAAVFASEYGNRLSVKNCFGSFTDGNSYDIKIFFDTDEEERRLRITERGGEGAYEKYQSEIRPLEDAYIEKNEPAINCDLVIKV